MTNYDTLPAGREMDALVAEKVMDRCAHFLKRDSEQSDDWDSAYYLCQKCGEEMGGLAYREGLCAFPHYSTDIKAAWSILENMGERFDIDLSLGWGGDEQWCCMLTAHRGVESKKYITTGYGASAPLAICRAALKAVSE